MSTGPSEPQYPPVVALVGPTAVGKSALALALAQRFGADIVTADSRQVYRYMDIGTAKPSLEEQASVRHYLLDLVAPDDIYSAERFAVEGDRVLRRIRQHGRIGLVAGGTGFYVRALLDRPSFPAAPPNFEQREVWTGRALADGPEVIHQELAKVDPGSAARIHPRNLARTIRALEIVAHAGGPIPQLSFHSPIPTLFLGLRSERAELHRRVASRVLEQVRAGLADETRALMAMGYETTSGPLAGFGYREMVSYIRGETTLEVAIDRYTIATRQYVRRQYTWFRPDDRIHWLEAGPDAFTIASELIERWSGGDLLDGTAIDDRM